MLIRGITKHNADSIAQLQCKPHETCISRHGQRSQHHDHIPTCSEPLAVQSILPNLREELLVALLPSEEARNEHAGSVDGEEGAYAVEFRGEDLEDDLYISIKSVVRDR